MSEFGEIVNIPKEMSTLRKQSELNSQDDTNESEILITSNGDTRHQSEANRKENEHATLETIQEPEYEYEQET